MAAPKLPADPAVKRAEARRRRLQRDYDKLLDLWETIRADVVAAYEDQDWKHLGFSDWDEYAADTFGVGRMKLATDTRREMAGFLLDNRLSQRAVAAVLGIAQGTVSKDAQVRAIESDSQESPAGDSTESPEEDWSGPHECREVWRVSVCGCGAEIERLHVSPAFS